MIGNSNIFSNFQSHDLPSPIIITNRSTYKVVDFGSINLSPSIILSSVLNVSKFSVNLLFISTITKVLNCKLEFFPDHCVFQDLQTGKTIGSGRLCDDLYLL
ncbi:hypothetical protein ERO13_D02G062066v2, partial [Gossypium hirsutum]